MRAALDRERLFAGLDRYFERTLAEHGASARGVDWDSEGSQERRFGELLKICRAKSGGSVIDYGCGYGALLPYMRARGYEHDYTGFDVSERMIEQARGACGDDRACRFATDEAELEPADYVVASGLFNLRLDVGDDAWRDYVVETIRSFDRLSRSGFAFNMLTIYSDSDRMRDDLYYADPPFFFDLCKRSFSRNVALLHDYDLYEFTILVRK